MNPIDELLAADPLRDLMHHLDEMHADERKDYLFDRSNEIIYALAQLKILSVSVFEGEFEAIKKRIQGSIGAFRDAIDSTIKEIRSQPLKDAGLDPAKLDSGSGGVIICNHKNIEMILRYGAEFEGLFTWDDFTKRYYYKKYPSWPYNEDVRAGLRHLPYLPTGDNAAFHICIKMNELGISHVSQDLVEEGIEVISKQNRFDYLQEYNDSWPEWDGIERNKTFPKRYFNIDRLELPKSHEDLIGAMWDKFLIGQMARCYSPGCDMKYMLQFEGEQHIGKSGLVKLLGGATNRIGPWFVEFSGRNIDMNDPDTFLKLSRAWVIEFGEMDAIRGSDVETVKNFISQTIDVYRPKFHKLLWEIPRRFVLIATVNPSEAMLRDTTGNVRFWPIPFGNKRYEVLPFEEIMQELPQNMAEARWKYKNGYSWDLNKSEQDTHNEYISGREIENPYLEMIEECIDHTSELLGVAIPEIIRRMVEDYKVRAPSTQLVGNILKSLGFERKLVMKTLEEQKGSRTKQKKVWFPTKKSE